MNPSVPTPDPAPGSRIGRFRLLEQLGQGGMGVVYRALEENLGREVALKVISPLFAHDPEFRERFSREARAQASLESAHVVAVYAHGEEDGSLYIASQLVPGGDLGHLIRTHGTPSLVEALEIIEQVASGLADAHDAGLVHRDIKPGNILVRRRPGSFRAYITDFGIARKMNADATRFSSSTAGTPSYMAPELHGGATANVSSDVYALGCLLWVALTGTPPYRGMSEYQLVAAHVREPVPQLAGTSPMVHAVNRILRTAMAKEPTQRYQSASEMGADLQAALRLPVTPGAAVPDAKGATALRPIVGREPSGGTPTPTPNPTPSPTPSPTPGPTPTGPAAGRPTPAGSPPRPAAPQTAFVPGGTPPPAPPGAPGPAFLGSSPTQPPSGPGGGSAKRWWGVGGLGVVTALAVGIGAALLTSGDDPEVESAFLDLEASEIVRASEKDMVVLETARINGQFSTEGEIVQVAVTATSRGDCVGTMTPQGSNGTAEFRRIGDTVYLRADAAYWDDAVGPGTADSVLPVIGEKWVVEDSLVQVTDDFCDLDEFLERDGREGAEVRQTGTGEVGGEKTVTIVQAKGSQSETLHIRIAEPHYLMRIDETEDAHFEFSKFDEPVEIVAPPPNEVFDLDAFLKKAQDDLGDLGLGDLGLGGPSDDPSSDPSDGATDN